jgi:hypothetical protein
MGGVGGEIWASGMKDLTKASQPGTRSCVPQVARPTSQQEVRQRAVCHGLYTRRLLLYVKVVMLVRVAGLEQPAGINRVRPRVPQFPFRVDIFLHQFPVVQELPGIHAQGGEQD